jgi:malonyl-CoA O-methyltransferase
MDVRSGYDRWSALYDQELNPLVLLEEPLVRDWIGDPSGLRVADVGCGTGRHARWLLERGASVDGFEASPGMLAQAAHKLAGCDVRLHLHALPQRLPLEDGAFDLVLLALVADHLADLVGSFRELRRVTRQTGTLVVTMLHPAMNLKGITARFTDPGNGSEVRVAAFEHTFSDYVMAVLQAGWTVERLAERKVDADLVAQTTRAEKYLDWPMLLAMQLSNQR